MKSGVALIILVILIALIILNSLFIERTVSEIYSISSTGENLTISDIHQKYNMINDLFSSREILISLSVSHEDLTDIEMILFELRGAIYAEDLEAAIIAKSRLENAILHLGRLSTLNIESIF